MDTATLSPLLLCPLCFAINGVAIRLFQTKITDADRPMLLFQGAYCLLAALLCGAGVRAAPTLRTLTLAAAFGCCFFLCTRCMAACYVTGPMSLTSVLVNASMLLPIFWSTLFFGDRLNGRMIVGILLVLLTFVLSSKNCGKSNERAGKKWLLLVSAAFLCNGATAILQKARQRIEPDGDLFVFLAIAYLISGLLFCLSYLFRQGERPMLSDPGVRRPLWWALVLTAGAGTFFGNCLLQFLCTRVAAGILYPVVNGGLCMLTAAASFALFRERKTALKLCSVATGVLGIVLLSL